MSFLSSAKRVFGIGYYDDDDEYYYDDRDYDEEEEYEEEKPRRSFFSFLSRSRDDEYEDFEEDAPEKNTSFGVERGSRNATAAHKDTSSRSGGISYAAAKLSGVEVSIITPAGFDDSSKIVKEVKNGKITVFDMSGMTNVDDARRIVDYVCGAAEGMDCPFSRICPSVFCIAPKGVTFNGKRTRY